MKRRIAKLTFLGAAGIAILYAILFPGYFSTHPDSHIGYVAWKHGIGSARPSYVSLFCRDSGFRDSFLGSDIDLLRKRFPSITRGSEFPEGSYRSDQYPPRKAGADDRFWFDDDPNGWSWAVDTKEGKIKRFLLIKG